MNESHYVNIAVPPLRQLYTYQVPDNEELLIGSGLYISFGRQKRFGYVVEEVNPDTIPEKTLAHIKKVSLEQEVFCCFLPEQLPFFRWIANYYCYPLSEVLETAIPKHIATKIEKYLKVIKEPEKPLKGKVQKEIFEKIASSKGQFHYLNLLKEYKTASAAVKALQEKGLIEVTVKRKDREKLGELEAPEWAKRKVELNSDQTLALENIVKAVNKREFCPFLLHGVTGSGKTEVYIEAILEAKKQGISSLVVVPEIALTPQLIDRFTARLGSQIAILHSAMTGKERWNSWQALANNETLIAIGARSGIFAPIKNLGLIIVDEEHDGSYKQSDGLRYNARDLAVVLATQRKCPVILGSATPSLETYQNALSKKFQYLPLRQRHQSGSDIEIKIVDMTKTKKDDLPSENVSKELYEALSEVLARGEQAFILYNRRGFASYLQCNKCNTVMKCPHCSVTLTLHTTSNRLKCHYCDYQTTPPNACPSCEEDERGELVQRGSGTEKVYDEIKALFPQARIARLDRDAAESPLQYRAILDDVRAGKTDILVGTQMIAKGHDLPGVTLVGIVDCDVGLNLPDFRASEKVFQLLTQASGRAGRGASQGRVFLQTHSPKHLSLIATERKSFAAFAKVELANRKDLAYPPFSRILRILVSSEDEQDPFIFLSQLKDLINEIITKKNLQVAILGPCPTTIAKIRNRWRWHILLKSKTPSALNLIMNALKDLKIKSSLRVAYDLDPQDLL